PREFDSQLLRPFCINGRLRLAAHVPEALITCYKSAPARFDTVHYVFCRCAIPITSGSTLHVKRSESGRAKQTNVSNDQRRAPFVLVQKSAKPHNTFARSASCYVSL